MNTVCATCATPLTRHQQRADVILCETCTAKWWEQAAPAYLKWLTEHRSPTGEWVFTDE